MTTAIQAGSAARVFHDFGIADGRARRHTHVQAPPPYSRRAPGDVDAALRSATPANVLSRLGHAKLPERFTPAQARIVKHMLDEYHPQTLARSPLIDMQGNPMSLRLAADPLLDNHSGDVIPIEGDLERALVRTFTHYRDNLRWQRENIAVETIRPGQAEPALVGQQGVFAKKDIPIGTPIGLFGGQYLDNPGDIGLDEKVRQMAGLPPHKYWDKKVSDTGGVVQAMCPMMKCNSAGKDANISGNAQINTIGPRGEKIRLMALMTTKPIKAGEELRMDYEVKP
ncbi:MAG: SET domain-containing protein [Janthinobacterium lividum]